MSYTLHTFYNLYEKEKGKFPHKGKRPAATFEIEFQQAARPRERMHARTKPNERIFRLDSPPTTTDLRFKIARYEHLNALQHNCFQSYFLAIAIAGL